MLLKWQAAILNHIYHTTLFNQIIIPSSSLSDIDYTRPLDVNQQLPNPQIPPPEPQLFLKSVTALCQDQAPQVKREHIMYLDRVAAHFNQHIKRQPIEGKMKEEKMDFGVYEVILFSGLSKCNLWPSMFKTSKTLVPSLIEFYNRFFNRFTGFLQYKFDPIILSSKYSRKVKEIKQQKLAHPNLFAAVEKDDLPRIEQLLKEGKPNLVNQCIREGLHLSHFAAVHASIPTLRTLLKLGADFELLDDQQQTALFYAVKRFDLQIIRFLVQEVGVKVNHTEYQHRTPIYLAAFEGNLDIVKYLHSKGGDPSIESKLSRTPLSKACYLGNVEVARYLIQLGVDTEATDSKGRTALHNAAWGRAGGRQGKRRGYIQLQDSPECVQLLIKAGHKVDFQDVDKFTPLFSAISSSGEQSLRILLKAGASLTHKTSKSQSAVFIACKYGHLNILRILIQQYNCCFQDQTLQGYTPLMATLTLHSSECSEYLLSLMCERGKEWKINVKLLECLGEFGKWEHLRYIVKWMGEDIQRKKFMVKAVEQHLEDLLNYTVANKNQDDFGILLQLMDSIHDVMTKQSRQKLMTYIAKKHFFNDTVLKMMLSNYKQGTAMPHINISGKLTQQAVITLLKVDSNLVQSIQTVYQLLLQLIQLRMSKVVLFIMQIAQKYEVTAKEGMGKYGKKDIYGVVFGGSQNKISVLDYCLVNGYLDMHRLLSSFYNQHHQIADIELQQRPVIPKYRCWVKQLDEHTKTWLMPLDYQKILDFKYYTKEILTAQEIQMYDKVREEPKKFKVEVVSVTNIEQVQAMKQHIDKHRLVGIDVEHYSSHNQSFICLIQIATLQRAFILDQFSPIHTHLQLFLNQLLANPNQIKVFHAYQNDLKWLCDHYLITQFQQVIDTSKIHALADKQKVNTPSLKWLASEFLQLPIKKQYQKSDWRIRPLFPQMALYAATDAQVLPFLVLAMLDNLELDPKKGHVAELLKHMQSKRLVRVNQRQIMIALE